MSKNKPWRNRIVATGEEDPEQLLANPKNWRVHPKSQQDAMAGVLDEVGWVQDVIVNRATGMLVDGHLRVSLALRRGEPAIPVTYVELTEAEEALILATFDPISAMAAADAEMLRDLLHDVSTGDAALQAMIAKLAGEQVLADIGESDTSPQMGGLEYRIIIECQSEAEQASMLQRFESEGIPCRALIS